MIRSAILLFLLFACALTECQTATAQVPFGPDDWPQWRGPNRDGISSDKGLLREWPADGPEVLWHVDSVGVSYSSIAIKDGRIFTVTINRPEVMNALHASANKELGGVFDDFVSDPDLWVAIITGEGDRAFSAGNDLKVTAAGGAGATTSAGATPTS